MNTATKTLSAPLRIYWALMPEELGGLSGELAGRLAAELASLRVFFVTVRLASGPRPDLPEIIAALKKGGVRVTVSLGSSGSFSGMENLSGVDGIDLSPEGADELEGLLDLVPGFPKGLTVSVSVVPARDNIDELADVIRRSLDAGIRIFSLPNPDVVSDGADAARFVLDASDRDRIKGLLEPLLAPYGDGVRLSVHDLFLHTALNLPGLGGVVEYAGCQAGDALGYIGGTGLVYPCSTWPEPLGRLGSCTFKEIWASESRFVMRDMVSQLPEECAGCPEEKTCKGGCVGLAYSVGRPGGKDPGCCRGRES